MNCSIVHFNPCCSAGKVGGEDCQVAAGSLEAHHHAPTLQPTAMALNLRRRLFPGCAKYESICFWAAVRTELVGRPDLALPSREFGLLPETSALTGRFLCIDHLDYSGKVKSWVRDSCYPASTHL